MISPTHSDDASFINANKYPTDETPIPPKEVETIISDKIPSDIIDKINSNENSGIHLKSTNSDVAKGDVFNALKETGKRLTFDVLDENSETKYSWSFNGSNIKNTNMDINLEIKFQSEKQQEIQKITNQSNMFYVSFSHHGELPGVASIKVRVSEMYKDGEEIYLYYYNEEKGTVEQTGDRVLVKNGYAEFAISHCSTYFFTTNPVENAGKAETKPTVDNTTSKKDDSNAIKATSQGGMNSTQGIAISLLALVIIGTAVTMKRKHS